MSAQLTSSVLLSCWSMCSLTMVGEKSTMKRRMSIEADLVCLFSEASVISRAGRTPRLCSVLKKLSRDCGCSVCENVQNSLRKSTDSRRVSSSVLSSVSCEKSSVRNLSSSCGGIK